MCLSGRQLDTLFHDWLFTATKPALPAATAAALTTHVPAVVKFIETRVDG